MATSINDVPMEENKESIAREPENLPICVVVLGMAGSGKTTLVQVSDLNILYAVHD